ncbi:MAG: class I SAM-dependent DNA methyltransferase [Pirellulaceae bacterium]|nr:class I SAM-dependent DNA methyltransferase [Pirellulaceae bacterium]
MAGLRAERLNDFIDWAAKHITGDEKGQAQIFLDRLFQAFGQPGCLDVGGTPEFRIRKSQEDGGGTAFADYVWKPVVLIEMKRRGEDLSRHFRQAFDYWTRLVPGRPRYVILCNFDEFWIYDFEAQMDSPVDMVRIEDLSTRYGPLAFLFPIPERPVFGNDHEAVTRDAADRLATCFHKLARRKDVDRDTARRFILQMLVALFAEDIGLLDQYLVVQLLEECKSPKDSYDLLGGLFTAMNTSSGMRGGRFKGVKYFNGGLFEEPARLELKDDELNQLKQAAKADWSKVQPEIFGTLFQHSMEAKERHAFGAHFTSPVDIMKIVGPTIVEPWRQLIEEAKTIKRLAELRQRLEHLRVLDPACGSGNFLYIAYREMKRLEARIFERMNELSSRGDNGQKVFGFVTAAQFFGIDINPFAIELAKVTMMIARKLAIDELHVNEEPLPLDNLDDNFLATDALIDAEGRPTKWPKADVIIGNPPFLGAKWLKPNRGTDYVNAVRAAYPDVPGMADYCVYWLRKAHDHLPECTPDDPVAGRAGLVGTQNIRNNKSRVGGLDYIVQSGTIVEAVDNQPWSGEANVHVSIADWVKHLPPLSKPAKREQAELRGQLLIPENKRLWFKVDPEPGKKKIRKKGSGPASKDYELAYRETRQINAALSDAANVSEAHSLECNSNPHRVYQGVTPGHDGFVLSREERKKIITVDRESRKVIFPYLTGKDLLIGDGMPKRYIIDFDEMDIYSALGHRKAFEHVKATVLPDLMEKAEREHHSESARKSHLEKWWMLWRNRTDLVKGAKQLKGRYVVCSRVTKRPIFVFLANTVRPSDKVQAFLMDDDYSFGVLQSSVHWRWFVAKCSKLTERMSYSTESVWLTFPWPQLSNVKQVNLVAKAGRVVRRVRDASLAKVQAGGLRAVYRELELPGKNSLKDAHAALDAAVLDAYGFSPRKDLLAQLLELNQAVAARIEAGETVIAPGIPPGYPDPARLVTDDCIRPVA